MGCRFATRTDEYHGWKCAETDGACMFFFPDEKKCFEEYGEGPLAFEEQEDEAEPCMKYAFMQLKDDFFALIDAEEYTFFDELLERGKSKETDIAIDEDSIDNTAYKLVYGGVLINTHLMDVETAIKTIDKMLNYAFLYIEKEKATVCTYCAIEMFPTISKAENWIPFVALMKLPVSLQNQSCSITLTPAISEKEHEKCLWEYMVNRPFLLACRYEAVIEELTEENYKDYVDLDYMIEAYNKADLVEI